MPGIFESRLRVYRENKERAESGGYNCIPFVHLPRFSEYIPGVQQKNYVLITANSKIGKSKFTKNLYVFKPYEFVMQHPEANIKFTRIYVCLEESKEAFMDSYAAYLLYQKHGIRVPVKEIKSTKGALSNHVLRLLEGLSDDVARFEDDLFILDYVKNPYGVYKECVDIIEQFGRWTYREAPFRKPNGDVEVKVVKDKFIYHHSQHYVEVVIDHLGLLHPEKGQDLHEAIRIMSSNYLISLRDKYNASVVAVQQQMAETEKKQYTLKGVSIEDKLEPTLAGLGDCKLTQRDCDEGISLFAPERHGLTEHSGYDITRLRDNYRSAKILMSRDDESNVRIGLFFDGASNYIEELPKADLMTDDDYTRYLSRVGRAPVQRIIRFGGIE